MAKNKDSRFDKVTDEALEAAKEDLANIGEKETSRGGCFYLVFGMALVFFAIAVVLVSQHQDALNQAPINNESVQETQDAGENSNSSTASEASENEGDDASGTGFESVPPTDEPLPTVITEVAPAIPPEGVWQVKYVEGTSCSGGPSKMGDPVKFTLSYKGNYDDTKTIIIKHPDGVIEVTEEETDSGKVTYFGAQVAGPLTVNYEINFDLQGDGSSAELTETFLSGDNCLETIFGHMTYIGPDAFLPGWPVLAEEFTGRLQQLDR